MRLLVAIPHYFGGAGSRARDDQAHGSLGHDPQPRVEALSECLSALHQQFSATQCLINIEQRVANAVNPAIASQVDVVVCTHGCDHVLPLLRLPADSFEQRECRGDPTRLGFECQRTLRERLGAYDFYAYMEDDLIVRDPWFFLKLSWFCGQFGDEALLQPNRYEVSRSGLIRKAYIDGDLRADLTAAFQSLDETPILARTVLDTTVVFQRPRNPHSGCFFLNARQMLAWSRRIDFDDHEPRFVGPLESAATLGIMRAFRVYKPAPVNAAFLEIQHSGTAFIGELREPG
jgi:hypothetical protein